MQEEKKYEIKEPKENLHWISHHARKQTDLLKEIKELLVRIEGRLSSNGGLSSKNEELPF